MIYNNYNVVQNIYEWPAAGRRTERPLLASVKSRSLREIVITTVSITRARYDERKLRGGRIDSLSRNGQDYNGCFVR